MNCEKCGRFFFGTYCPDCDADKINAFTKKCCPNCNGMNYHAFIEKEIIRPEKTKGRTSLNLNPLKPFTIFNYKEKVVKKEISRQVSKFLCDDCGHVFK